MVARERLLGNWPKIRFATRFLRTQRKYLLKLLYRIFEVLSTTPMTASKRQFLHGDPQQLPYAWMTETPRTDDDQPPIDEGTPESDLRARSMPALPPDAPIGGTISTPPVEVESPSVEPPLPSDPTGASAYRLELDRKIAALAEDFSLGKINRHQFDALYMHYRDQRHILDAMLTSHKAEAWRTAIGSGMTGLLLQRNAAQLLGHALYDNATSLPLATSPNFQIEAALIPPLIATYRHAAQTQPTLGGSELPNGQWLSLIVARFSTLVAVFSLEPARVQLQFLQELHHDFELANAKRLSRGEGHQAAEQFIQLWALEKMV